MKLDVPGIYDNAKRKIKQALCMKFYETPRALYLETDASGVSLGVGLLQVKECMNSAWKLFDYFRCHAFVIYAINVLPSFVCHTLHSYTHLSLFLNVPLHSSALSLLSLVKLQYCNYIILSVCCGLYFLLSI